MATASDETQQRRRRRGAAVGLLVLVLQLLLVVAVVPTRPGMGSLPRFDQQDIKARKAAFFDYLRPIARYHNERIAQDRAEIEALAAGGSPGWLDRRGIRRLAGKYGIDLEDTGYERALELLERRVDVIPESLVLVQAAKESAWGRSRFARGGNALFGEWCFTEGCGMVPDARPEGRVHEVQSFASVYDAVGSYMRNLNTHASYVDLRTARRRMRENGRRPSGIDLAEYLAHYSERRGAYVAEIKAMIRQNGLESD